ncbi:MAG: hypothetical protein KGL39_34190 [Patescibacteria group bacterium]|nr:hypothetical protein [Patescibacteria group bacterium]
MERRSGRAAHHAAPKRDGAPRRARRGAAADRRRRGPWRQQSLPFLGVDQRRGLQGRPGNARHPRPDLRRRRAAAHEDEERMKRLFAVIAAVAGLAFAQAPALTTVSQSMYGASGTVMIVANSTFTTSDGYVVPKGWETTVTVTGTLSVDLPPNVGSTPSGTSYTAYYNVTPGGQYSETWVVPSSASPVDLAAVRTSPAPTPSLLWAITQINAPANCYADGGILHNASSSPNDYDCVASLVNPMTAEGDLILGGPSGGAQRLAAGASGDVLTSNGPGQLESWQPAGGASMIYPGAGVANSTGSAWGASYGVGSAANDLLQVGAGGTIPSSVVPTLNQDTTGTAALADALAAVPAQCVSGDYSTGIAASGAANCAQVNFSQLGGTSTLSQLPQGCSGCVLLGQGAAPPAYVADPEVQGLDASGSPPTGSPVLMGGSDSTDVRTLLTDSSGHLLVNVTSIPTVSLNSLPAGTNHIGGVNIDQLAGVALAGPSNYGTAPSGEVQGVNAYITNTLSVQQATGANLHVDVDNLPGTQPVSGTVTVQQATAASLNATVTGTVNVGNFPGTQAVSGTVTANAGTGFPAVNPCQSTAPSVATINQASTSTTQIIAASSGKKVYICGVQILPIGTATTFTLVSGTGTNCGTIDGSNGLIGGGTTAAAGISLAANGGFVEPPSGIAYAATPTASDEVCIIEGAANQISGTIQYVQQ